MKDPHEPAKPHPSVVTRLPIRRWAWLRALPLAVLGACGSADDMNTRREALIAEIEADVRLTAHELGFSRLDPAVIERPEAVPRQRFVPERQQDLAYGNHPLPIGMGQTISQPYIVADHEPTGRHQARRPGLRAGDRVRLPGGGAGGDGRRGL